jgi:hypothetical protein
MRYVLVRAHLVEFLPSKWSAQCTKRTSNLLAGHREELSPDASAPGGIELALRLGEEKSDSAVAANLGGADVQGDLHLRVVVGGVYERLVLPGNHDGPGDRSQKTLRRDGAHGHRDHTVTRARRGEVAFADESASLVAAEVVEGRDRRVRTVAAPHVVDHDETGGAHVEELPESLHLIRPLIQAEPPRPRS